jgi:hypothetical protein
MALQPGVDAENHACGAGVTVTLWLSLFWHPAVSVMVRMTV